MQVTVTKSYDLCWVEPWVSSLEAWLKYTHVEYNNSGDPKAPKVQRTVRHLWQHDKNTLAGVFPAGLFKRAVERLIAGGHKVAIRDVRDTARTKPIPNFDAVKKLRGGQDRVLVAIAVADSGVIVASTAFGKSFCITQICQMYPALRVLITSPRAEVVKSLFDRLVEALGSDQVGIATGTKCIKGRRVTVTTTKSMLKVDPNNVDLLLFDEVHGVGDNQVTETLIHFNKCRRFGFTASPFRGDGAEMVIESIFGPFLVEIDYKESVELGNVVPIRVEMIPVVNKVKQYRTQYLNKRYGYWMNRDRNGRISHAVQSIATPEEQTLVMVETLEHGIYLKRLLPDFTLIHSGKVEPDTQLYEYTFFDMDRQQYSQSASWQVIDMSLKDYREFRATEATGRPGAYLGRVKLTDLPALQPQVGDFVNAELSEDFCGVPIKDLTIAPKQLDAYRNAFRDGQLLKAISTGVWKEGVDFCQLALLVRADGASSKVNSTQIPGRLSRLYDGKSEGLLLDCMDEFNDWGLQRTNARLETYRRNGWNVSRYEVK